MILMHALNFYYYLFYFEMDSNVSPQLFYFNVLQFNLI